MISVETRSGNEFAARDSELSVRDDLKIVDPEIGTLPLRGERDPPYLPDYRFFLRHDADSPLNSTPEKAGLEPRTAL